MEPSATMRTVATVRRRTAPTYTSSFLMGFFIAKIAISVLIKSLSCDKIMVGGYYESV